MASVIREEIRRKAGLERSRIVGLLRDIGDLSDAQRARICASYMRAWRRNQHHATRSFMHLSMGFSLLLGIPTGLWVSVLQAQGEEKLANPPKILVALCVLFFIAGATVFVTMRLDRTRDFASHWAHRSDLLVALMIPLVATSYEFRPGWRYRKNLLRLRFRVDYVAREMAATRVRVRRARWISEWKLRRAVKVQDLRLSMVIRSHSNQLVLVGRQGEYEEICRSLRDLLVYAAEDDWDSLLGRAPEVSEASLALRVVVRLWPAALLLGGALLLPLVPAFSESADDIRKFLIPMAVLAALGASESVSNSFRGVLDKIIFSGK